MNKETKENSLAAMRPDLAAEWNYEKNGDLKPDMIASQSHKKVWWILPYDDPITGKHFDFEWEAKIQSRVRGGHGCPYLSGQALWVGFNDLQTRFPSLAAEWHPTKNGTLKPNMVTYGIAKKVWWLLPYDDPITGKHFDFEWEAKINNRAQGAGCPYLTNRYVWPGFNDLLSCAPDVAKEWHPTKNGDLTPLDVIVGSHAKVWWLLPYDDPKTGKHFDFEWEAIVQTRVNGAGCPFLAHNGAIWVGFNDLITTDFEIAKQWNYKKNKDLIPSMVSRSSTKKVWWYLPYDDPKTGKHFDFEWEATINSRTQGAGCPFLSTNPAAWPGFNDLETLEPKLALEWNYEKNKGLLPSQVTRCADKKVWWKIIVDGEVREWKATVASRTSAGCGCPELNESHLEKIIRASLDAHDIKMVSEKKFNNLRSQTKQRYRYDFYLSDFYMLIEGDGKQHFEDINMYKKKGGLMYRANNDNIKNEYAFSNNIPLLRIPYIYDHQKNRYKIESLILEFINTKRIPQEIIDFYSQFEFSNYVECVNKYHNKINEEMAAA